VTCERASTPLPWLPQITPQTPRALSAGEPCRYTYAVSVLADAKAWHAATAAKRGRELARLSAGAAQ